MLLAFSVSFRERVKPWRSLSGSACGYLALRAEFTMPPRKESLSTLRNLRTESQQSAPKSDLFQGGLPRNSGFFLELFACGEISGRRRFLLMSFSLYRDCMRRETVLNSKTSCRYGVVY